MREFEELNIWKEAKELTLEVYKIFKDCKDYGFKDQIQRAAVSIMNNIAEGSESGSDAKFINFLNIAKGSCGEVRSMLYLCSSLGFCAPEVEERLRAKCKRISGGLSRLIDYLSSNPKH